MQNNLDIILQQISKGQILTTEQVDKFLTLVLTSLSAQKKELDKENTERLFEFKEVMKYIEKEHKDVLKDWEDKLDTKTTEVYNKIKAGFNTEITKAKEIIQELRAIKLRDGVDGKDGEPGKDADETKIVAKVLKKLPKSKDYSAVGIKDMLESLEDDDRLDYGVLKNIPDLSQLANPIMAGAGGRLLSQMNDVDISGVTDNSVLIWDEERSIWKIGTTSAGSGTVTSVSVVTANGISGTVANPTTTPAITLDISGLDATKIADGSISNTEFQYLNGVSSNIQTQLDGKVDENAAITGATKTKITYDAKGLVTGGADATTADIADTTNKRYVTDAQLTVIGNTSGTNTGDQTTITGNSGTATALQTARTIGTITGDATSAGSTFDGSANNTNALTLATVNSNVGTFGSATQASQVTVNAKGLVTAASSTTITPAVGSITGLGTGVGTFLATPSSANLAAALTDETGSGSAVFGTSPTLTTPTLQASKIDYVIEPATDDTFEGEMTNDVLAGDTIAQWDMVYLDSTSGRWEFADADAVATSGGVLLALSAEAKTDGQAMNVVLRGIVRNDGWTWSGAGKPLYVSTTAGGMTETAPSGAADVIRIVGYTLSDDAIYFNPDNAYVVHA